MSQSRKIAVTGAFSYSGKYITRLLLEAGHVVITLTNHPGRPNPFGEQVKAYPYNFTKPEALTESLKDVHTLINTYWVRFNYGSTTYDQAVENTRRLISAARAAGVQRLVHISITNASPTSPLPYFRGKGILEQFIQSAGLPYAIIRPTVIFGPEDILINNIAFLLRRWPLFAIPGAGDYKLQPVFVQDFAALVVEAALGEGDMLADAVGPETFTYQELVAAISTAVGGRARVLHAPPAMVLLFARLLGVFLGDVILTGDELRGLMSGLLVSRAPPTCQTSFREWLLENRSSLGVRYASELARHFR